jgi:iron complex outermembrane recepter protein
MLRITAFLAVIIPIFVSAQTYQISGRVSGSDGVVLPGAVVMVHENLITVETGKNGDFLIPGLKPGKYHLHIRYIGYESAEKDVTIGSTYVVEESLLKAREGESSLKIIVAGKEFLRRNPGFSLSNQLESLPGIHSLNTGTGIAKPVIRGFSFQRVVADKGIKQEGQQWGSDHGLEIDQFDVDRLEIIKGPSSLIFGSDAIGGVINIRLPEYPAKNSLQVNTASTYRSANDLWAMSGQIKANISDLLLSFRYSHQDYADYRVPADSFTYNSYKLPLHNQKLKNTAGREQNFSASIGLSRNWGYSILSVSRFSQRAGFFSGAHGIPQSYQLGLDGDSRNIDIPYQFVEHYKVISNTNLQIRKGWLEIDLGYQRNFRQEFSVAENHGNDYVFDTTNIEHQLALITVSGNLRYHFGKEKSGKWILGGSGQYQENQFAGFEFLLPNYRGWGAGTYLYFARKLSLRWHLNAGIRGDINRLDVQA